MTKLKWAVDPTHSDIGFKIKHMMFTNISGKFTRYEASMETEGSDFDTALFHFVGQINSLSTGNIDRDEHLQRADFFDANQYPTIEFQAKLLGKKSAGNHELRGDLTMHGVTKMIALQVEMSGLLTDPWGRKKVAFLFSGKLNRKDWNLGWNAALESGGVLVGEEVTLIIELQFIAL